MPGVRETREAMDPAGDRNEVILVGRLAAGPQERLLPSGDVITTFRLVVRRPPRARNARRRAGPGPAGPTVDTVDCTAWDGRARRTVAPWQAGDIIEVAGALRRRFWRSPGGPASRYEVEVARVRRLHRAER